MDIHDVRRARLRQIAQRFDTDAEFARAIGIDPSLLSRMIGAHPSKQLGHKLARSIETRLNIPTGWLDNLDAITLRLSDKFATLATAQQTLIGTLLDHPIDDAAAAALTTLITRL